MSDEAGRAGRYTVLFDGDCPLCRKSVETLRMKDLDGILEFLPAQDPGVGEDFPWVSSEALSASLHLVGPGGETWEGARAVEELTRILPGFRWMEPLFRLPFGRLVARGVYRLVARNRLSS